LAPCTLKKSKIKFVGTLISPKVLFCRTAFFLFGKVLPNSLPFRQSIEKFLLFFQRFFYCSIR
jgi:hypothetical protein